MARVYVSIGSNIDRRKNITSSIGALQKIFGEVALSTVYENKAIGFEGNNFFNLVAVFDTPMPVRQVAEILHEIENQHGRKRGGERFSSRTLDIDLLLYGDLVQREGGLELPRNEITRYAFVLKPLAEIAGDVVHPTLHKTMSELWQNFGEIDEPMKPVAIELT